MIIFFNRNDLILTQREFIAGAFSQEFTLIKKLKQGEQFTRSPNKSDSSP
jgi:hypothetical protein